MKLEFTDGMQIETDGPPRVISKSDGMYVVGNGMCIPVDTKDEALKTLQEFKAKCRMETKEEADKLNDKRMAVVNARIEKNKQEDETEEETDDEF